MAINYAAWMVVKKHLPNHVNWGEIIGWVGVIQCTGAAIGYACAKDVRHALYYLFAAAITICVIWR